MPTQATRDLTWSCPVAYRLIAPIRKDPLREGVGTEGPSAVGDDRMTNRQRDWLLCESIKQSQVVRGPLHSDGSCSPGLGTGDFRVPLGLTAASRARRRLRALLRKL